MTTIDRLITLCEKAAIHLLDSTSYEAHCAAQNRFRNACDPQTILAICAENKRLTEEVERLRGEGWQPIETAPMDGTSVLGYREGYKRIMVWWYYNNRWSCDASYHAGPWDPPTHWMPILPFSGVPAHSTSAAAEGAVTVSDSVVMAACIAAYSACDMGPFPSMAVDPASDLRFVRAALEAALAAARGGENR